MDLARKNISNKLVIIGTGRKKCGIPSFDGKNTCLKRIRGYNTGGGRWK